MSVRVFGFILAAGLISGCNGNGNGSDGGGEPCADSFCSSRETCVNESICVPVPTKPANACQEGAQENIYEVVGPADLACHNAAVCTQDAECPQDASQAQLVCQQGFCGVAAPQGPQTVTFRGCVDAFGIGDTTHQMRVALYRTNQDPTGASTWDVATFDDQAHCEYWGAFEFENVPTNTPLILKSYDDQGDFVVTYKYNLILWADLAKDEGGTFVFDTKSTISDPRTGSEISLNPWRGYAISQTTYDIILLAAGISELPETHGAIAGTIRDCGYHEMQNVTCGVVDEPRVLTYMSNQESPRPDMSLSGTNVNGMYAAMDIPEGSHKVSCLAQDSQNAQVLLGEYQVKVFPHAVTILSMDWYPAIQ
jgi:hypothetical protein